MTLLHDQVSGGQMALHLTVEYFGVQRNFVDSVSARCPGPVGVVFN